MARFDCQMKVPPMDLLAEHAPGLPSQPTDQVL